VFSVEPEIYLQFFFLGSNSLTRV